MTEYATTPSALEEWRNQRNRTADWVQHYAVPGLPPTPTSSSDSDNRSLWSGHGWEPPSDCESSTSVPPTMMLQYPDSRQVMISPASAGEGGDSKRIKNRNGSGHRTNHAYIAHGDEERTERARSLRSAGHPPTHTHTHATVNTNPGSTSAPLPVRDVAKSRTGRATTNASANAGAGAGAAANPSQTSSMRLARAAAAPLPDSHSSSSGSAVRSVPVSAGGVRSAVPRSVSKKSSDAVPVGEAADAAEASHIATSTHSHPSHIAPRSTSRPESTRAPSHAPTINPPVPSGQPSHVPTHPPSYRPSHAASQQQTSHVASNASAPLALSHQRSAPSNAPSHQLSQNQAPSEHPTHQPLRAPTHQPSQAHTPSHQPSQAVSHRSQVDPTPSHPPSVFSNHTITPDGGGIIPPQPNSPSGVSDAPGVSSPPSIHSINSRAISVSDSRSSCPPEQIFVHPPSNPSVNSVHPAANVPLPPSSIASASLSYFSVPPRQSHDYHQEQKDFVEAREEGRRGSIAPSHHTSHSHSQSQQQQNGHTYNGQLPTPISPIPNSSLPIRTPSTSTMSGSGLGGGYVLVDIPSAGYEKEVEHEGSQRKGSGSGGKSERQNRERKSLFGVFGKHGGGHTRSKSLPMNGMDVLEEGARTHEKEIHVSPSHLGPPSNPYPTPTSPLSPNADPLAGPHPPPIVYAPARHHRATRYSPPRIMYSPRGSRQKEGKREVPYDMQHPPGQGLYSVLSPSPYPQMHPQSQQYQYPYQQQYAGGSPVVYVQTATPLMSPGYAHGYAHGHTYSPEHATAAGVGSKGSLGSVRRSKTVQETPGLVRDSGWDEGKRDTMRLGSAYRHHSANVGDIIVHDSPAQVPGQSFSRPHSHLAPTHSPRASTSRSRSPVPASPNRSNVNINPNTTSTPVSPTMSQVAAGTGREGSIRSDATSTRTNLAGVGTVSARSRSRGRSVVQNGDLGHISEGEGEAEDEVGVIPGGGESIREMGEIDARGRSRSRSRARGMVYSTSAPQPQTHAHGIAPPHAAMMIPPSEAMTERGVRDTPYPTPPASVSEQALLQQRARRGGYEGQVEGVVPSPNLHPDGSAHLNGSHAPPGSMNGASPGPSGLASRFHDIYQTNSPRGAIPSHLSPPRARRDHTSSSSRERGRRRARERRGREGRVRSASVDSDASCSSVSTYYVLPSPGQKVRIVRTDGVATTTTTTVSRNNSGVGLGPGSGWLRKAAALRPKFLHREHANPVPQSQPQPHPHLEQSEASPQKSWYSQSNPPARLEAPVIDSRTASGGADSAKSGKSGKSGKKGGRKLVRRNSTGSAALLKSVGDTGGDAGDAGVGVSRHGDEGGEDVKVPVDIVIPGR